MPFGVGYDNVGQAPGSAVGFQQQLAQFQQQVPGLLQALNDPQKLQQAAGMLAQQFPAPPLDFTTPVGSGTPGPENSVGLPQGVRPGQAGRPGVDMPMSAPPPNPFDFSLPPSPEAKGGGGGGGFLNALFNQVRNPMIPGMSGLPGDVVTPLLTKLPNNLVDNIFGGLF